MRSFSTGVGCSNKPRCFSHHERAADTLCDLPEPHLATSVWSLKETDQVGLVHPYVTSKKRLESSSLLHRLNESLETFSDGYE